MIVHASVDPEVPAASPATGAVYPDLRGRVAVVTGGSRGLGAAVCLALGVAGVRVVVSGRDASALARTVEEVRRAGGEAIAVAADATRGAEVAALHEAAIRAFGAVDLLVPFAGGDGPQVPTVETTPEDWDATIAANLGSTFLALRTFVPGMQARGRGAVVTMASAAPRTATAASAPYAAAKAGVMALTRCAALEAAPHGIRVNAVAPSLVMHPFLAKVTTEELLTDLTSREAFGRSAEPWEVANVIVFLASEYSTYMTGEVVSVSSRHP